MKDWAQFLAGSNVIGFREVGWSIRSHWDAASAATGVT